MSERFDLQTTLPTTDTPGLLPEPRPIDLLRIKNCGVGCFVSIDLEEGEVSDTKTFCPVFDALTPLIFEECFFKLCL